MTVCRCNLNRNLFRSTENFTGTPGRVRMITTHSVITARFLSVRSSSRRHRYLGGLTLEARQTGNSTRKGEICANFRHTQSGAGNSMQMRGSSGDRGTRAPDRKPHQRATKFGVSRQFMSTNCEPPLQMAPFGFYGSLAGQSLLADVGMKNKAEVTPTPIFSSGRNLLSLNSMRFSTSPRSNSRARPGKLELGHLWTYPGP